VLAAVALSVPLSTMAWLVAWSGRYVEPFARVGVRCGALTLVLATALFGALFAMRTRRVPFVPAMHGAALGATSGAWAAVLVDLWCPLTSASHVLVGHAAPMVILALLGAVGGRYVLAVREIDRG
jgi:hypothetical protein